MYYHRSLLQIVDRMSHIVMLTKNVFEASYHAGNCTSIKLFSMTDRFTEHVQNLVFTGLGFSRNRSLCNGSFCAFRAHIVNASDLRMSSRGRQVTERAWL